MESGHSLLAGAGPIHQIADPVEMLLAGSEIQLEQSAACARTRAPMRDHVDHLLLSGLSWETNSDSLLAVT